MNEKSSCTSETPPPYQQNTFHEINFIIPHLGFGNPSWGAMVQNHFRDNPHSYAVRVMNVWESREPESICRIKPLINSQGKHLGIYLLGIVTEHASKPVWLRRKNKKPVYFLLEQLPEVITRIHLSRPLAGSALPKTS